MIRLKKSHIAKRMNLSVGTLTIQKVIVLKG